MKYKKPNMGYYDSLYKLNYKPGKTLQELNLIP